MITATRRRTAIELPVGISRRRPVFAMAGEPANDIVALGRQFEAFNAAVSSRVDAIEAGVDGIAEQMASLRVNGIGATASRDGLIRAEYDAITAFVQKARRSSSPIGYSDELLNIHTAALKANNVQAAMSVGSDPDGGYLVMPTVSTTMTQKLFDTTAMRRLARVETMVSGDRWEEPIDNDEVNSGWVGETDPRPTTKSPKLGKLTVPLCELYAEPPVTQTLLDCVGFNLGEWLIGKITDKFGRDEGRFIDGDGVLQPQGLLSVPVATTSDATRPWGTIQYVPTANAGDFASSNPADVLKSLVWTLRAPYRAGASWLMNSNTMSRIDKFKDGMGNYLLRPGLTAGVPDMLLGYPVVYDDVAMPDIAANSLSVAFGNFKRAYLIVDRIGLKMIIDPFTQKPYVLFYAYKRTGGGVANSEAVKLLKFSAS